MANAAQTLFDSIQTEVHLQSFVDAGEQEDLHIDFKTVPRIDDIDAIKADLSKALSALANASGGVIVWGVDCRDDRVSQIDKVRKLAPVSNVERLRTILNGNIARATNPAVEGVDNRIIPSKGETGYIVTLVPESIITPHMAAFGKHEYRYFRRHGNQSIPMEHNEVADMFGRRQRPNLNCFLKVQKLKGDDTNHFHVVIILGLRNTGRAVAKFPMLEVSIHPRDRVMMQTWETPLPLVPTSKMHWIKFGGGANNVVHIGEEYTVCQSEPIQVDVYYWKGFDVGADYRVTAEGLPIKAGRLLLTKEWIEAIAEGRRESSYALELEREVD